MTTRVQWTNQFSISKRIENPSLNYQSEGTKSILVCAGGTLVGYDTDAHVRYDRGARVRTIEVLAHGAHMTYGRLPMGERTARASSEHRSE